MTRFEFLRVLAFLLGALLSRPLRALADMVPRVFSPPGRRQPLTPVSQFYVEDYSGPPKHLKNGTDPWRLEVHGKVDRPLSLTPQALLARPSVQRIITLNCIGNPVGGQAIGTAEWEGLALETLLEEADPHFFAGGLVVRGADGYEDSLPLSKADHPGALLAYRMNGAPLTLDHGYPLRLVIPGLYGIKQVKWVQEIEVTDQVREGYWQKRGWSREARVKIFSRIDVPEDGDWLTERATRIEGIAFAGDRGIQYVQVSIDGGAHWALASLRPPLSPYAWVFWSCPVTFPGPGRYDVGVRAADRYSGIQRDDARNPFPNGTSGLHWITVYVV